MPDCRPAFHGFVIFQFRLSQKYIIVIICTGRFLRFAQRQKVPFAAPSALKGTFVLLVFVGCCNRVFPGAAVLRVGAGVGSSSAMCLAGAESARMNAKCGFGGFPATFGGRLARWFGGAALARATPPHQRPPLPRPLRLGPLPKPQPAFCIFISHMILI